jgi:hypothetical protein
MKIFRWIRMKNSKSFQRLAVLFAIVASSLVSIQPAKASETVLLNNGLEWCQGCYDGRNVTNGATQWIAFVVTASSAATVSKIELYMDSTNAVNLAGSTVSFYGNPTSAPKQSGDLLGTLTFTEFRLQPSQSSSGAAVFTGSVAIPSAGQYWFRFGNLSPDFDAGYRFGLISNQTGPWSAYQGTPNMNFFDGGNQGLANYYPAVRITGSVGATVTATDTAAQNLAASIAAAAKREAEKMVAREDIISTLKIAKDLTVDLFARAEIPGITSQNIVAVQAELLALPEKSRVDINQVRKIARKYEVVGKIASDQFTSIHSDSLIEIGLIPQESKQKAAITAAIKKLPPSDRSTYASIKKAIDAEMAEIQNRKDRLANVIARNASRYTK